MKRLVFISAKSQDYDIARKVYKLLTDHKINTFFSDETLKQLGNSDYRNEIDNNLDAAEHMIVVTTSGEHVRSKWVEAEWGFFVNEKRSGRKNGNLITVISGDIRIDQLPPSLRYYEVISMYDSWEDRLLGYVKNLIENENDPQSHNEREAVRLAEKTEIIEEAEKTENVEKTEIAAETEKVEKTEKAEETEKIDKIEKTRKKVDAISDVPLVLKVILGSTRCTINEILAFSPGTVIKTDKRTDELVDLTVNGKVCAKGEIVVIDESFGIRVAEVVVKVKPENVPGGRLATESADNGKAADHMLSGLSQGLENPGLPASIKLIEDVPITVVFELGSTRKRIEEILKIGPGSIVELDRLAEEPVDIVVL
jgi:flagellar motor switch protein FliN